MQHYEAGFSLFGKSAVNFRSYKAIYNVMKKLYMILGPQSASTFQNFCGNDFRNLRKILTKTVSTILSFKSPHFLYGKFSINRSFYKFNLISQRFFKKNLGCVTLNACQWLGLDYVHVASFSNYVPVWSLRGCNYKRNGKIH